MSYSYGMVEVPVNQYDVQQALGTSECDLGSLCRHANINPMAKYKPVRVAKREKLTDADFFNADYGLVRPSTFVSSNPNPSTAWTYNRPDTPYCYRISDFDKYDHNAAAPFAFDFSGELGASIGIYFFVDSGVNGICEAGKHWYYDTCLSVNDLLRSQTFQSMYLCFCIHDLTEPLGGTAVVVSNVKLSEMSSTVPTVILYAEAQTVSGMTCPAVSLLGDRDRSGHTFRVICGLVQNFPENPLVYSYVEMTGSLQNIDVYSLAFSAGVDRKQHVLTVLDTIEDLEFSLTSSTLAFTYIETVTRSGGQWKKYLVTGRVYGRFVTPNGQWAVDSVSVDVTLRTDGGYVNPIDNGTSLVGRDNVWSKGGIDISIHNHTYNNVEVAYLVEIPVYIYKDAQASLRVSARARYNDETKDADNILIVSS